MPVTVGMTPTGTFLTSDPLGYGVSGSNLYSFGNGDPINNRDPRGEGPCKNTTLASLQASGGAALAWGKNAFVSFMDCGGRQAVKLVDTLTFGPGGWVHENAEEARRQERRALSKVVVALERGEATPVHVIGGAVDQRIRAIDAANQGCKEDVARAATGPLLDLAALRGAVGDPVTPRSTPAPAVVTNTGVILPGVARTPATSFIAPVFLASNADDEGTASDEMQLGKHGEMPSPRPGKNSHHGVMSQWMRMHFAGYDPDQAPAILMATENDRATFGVYTPMACSPKTGNGWRL